MFKKEFYTESANLIIKIHKDKGKENLLQGGFIDNNILEYFKGKLDAHFFKSKRYQYIVKNGTVDEIEKLQAAVEKIKKETAVELTREVLRQYQNIKN